MPCAKKLTATSHDYQDNRGKQEGGGTVVRIHHAILPTASGDFATVSWRRSIIFCAGRDAGAHRDEEGESPVAPTAPLITSDSLPIL